MRPSISTRSCSKGPRRPSAPSDGEIASFVADVAVEDQVRAAVEGAVERFGALHVLYNNAGVLWRDRDVSVLETDEEVWDRVFAINLKGMVWVCKYGIPHLIAAAAGPW